MIPDQQRGMYQAVQNILHGLGAICGVTLGGIITDSVGWKTCFHLQVPLSLLAYALTYTIISADRKGNDSKLSIWASLDLIGATTLFVGLSLQLTAMSLSSELSWNNTTVIAIFLASVGVLAAFVVQESRCKAIPVLPLNILVGRERIFLLICNICVGLVAYGVCINHFIFFLLSDMLMGGRQLLFILPLYFQVVLMDTPSSAGLRLVPPSLATPLGGLATGIAMRNGNSLTVLTRFGLVFMAITMVITGTIELNDKAWKFSAYTVVGNFGQGVVYPSILFGFIRASETKGKLYLRKRKRLPDKLRLTRK